MEVLARRDATKSEDTKFDLEIRMRSGFRYTPESSEHSSHHFNTARLFYDLTSLKVALEDIRAQDGQGSGTMTVVLYYL